MDNDYMKVKGHEGLLRDPHTNSIVNTDHSEYNEYLSRKQAKSKDNQKIQSLEEDLANMKSDIDEIKSLLRSIANGSK